MKQNQGREPEYNLIQIGSFSSGFILVCMLLVLSFPRLESRTATLGALQAETNPKGTITYRRPVTVTDVIETTKLPDNAFQEAAGQVALFSPNRTKFIVVLRKGDVQTNTNIYSILLWETNGVFPPTKPKVLLTMVSSSNRPAIQSVSWRSDNETLFFLGEHPGELQQLYSFNIRTQHLQRLTNFPTNLISYSAPDAASLAFIAEKSFTNSGDKVARFGKPITTELITEVLLGHPDEQWSDNVQLCVQPKGDARGLKVLSDHILLPFAFAESRPIMSPNGRYVLLLVNVLTIPSSWTDYHDVLLKKWTAWKTAPGQYSMLRHYLIFDTRTGERKILMDAPVSFGGERSQALWAPDSQSVVITNTYLPLDGVDEKERETRRESPFAVEIQIPSSELTKISPGKTDAIAWVSSAEGVILEDTEVDPETAERKKIFFRKQGPIWEQTQTDFSSSKEMEIRIEQDLITPPKIVASQPDNRQPTVLLDLNPQFKNLKFSREEQIRWRATDGHEVEGGLYYPVDYVPGKRYPLVIQTHGFRPGEFEMDGPYTSVFAAQPLAGKGIMVLQAEKPDRPELLKIIATPREAAWRMAAYEGAIDYLDKQGLIDKSRVGIVGFSRTCWFVKYMLTHSHFPFAAVSVSDGFDMGYFSYAATANRAYPDEEMDQIMGGPPVGPTMPLWVEASPGFNVDKISNATPIRIVAPYALDVLIEWQWFAMMKRLQKPVDFVVFLDGIHVLEKPFDRIISQGGNVDWFDFWLNGHEDPDPTKREEFERWKKLQEQRN